MQRRRRQTHSTEIKGKRYIWYTDRLWKLAQDLPEFEVEVESFQELDQDCWFSTGRTPTIREVAAHCKRINEANTEFPVIINENGRLIFSNQHVKKDEGFFAEVQEVYSKHYIVSDSPRDPSTRW